MNSRSLDDQLPLRNIYTLAGIMISVFGSVPQVFALPIKTSDYQSLHSGIAIEPKALIAGTYVAPDGTLQPGAAIVLSSGKIKSIRPADQYADKPDVIKHPHAVICPGLIDVRSSVGVHNNNIESAFPIDPGATVLDAIDWHHRDFYNALEAGITTVVITPSDKNLISGSSAVVKTAGHDDKPIVLRRDGPLMFALGRSVLQLNRAPTSQSGALSMLRDALDQAKQGKGHQRLQSFVSGKQDAMIVCHEAMDVSSALKTLTDLGREASIAYTGDELELVHEFSGLHRSIVIGPYMFSMPLRTLSGAAAFDTAGIPVVFCAQTPVHSGDWLRITAALAVRHGLRPEKARQAITLQPARVAGVAHRVGAIKPGMDADLVVFSGDPLRLDSRILEVYINGIPVYRFPDEQSIDKEVSPRAYSTGVMP